ncbi:MAG: conserved membrane protein of unknown function [Candidatus Thorarchaeota archaeon]|nr:MAG: conserved membrane protein of unknown function [Candidatus Thorarchaeota archaeon]
MQTNLEFLLVEIIGIGLIFQISWLFLSRYGRGSYLSDLTRFAKPSGRLSRYYSWRMESTKNAILEGVAIISIVTISSIFLAFWVNGLSSLLFALPYLLFVVALVTISAVQVVVRVKRLSKREEELLKKMEEAEYKVDEANQIVDWLHAQGKEGDGRLWFVLYRTAQLPNPIGYAIRDALLEKRKEIEEEKIDVVPSEKKDEGIGID